MVDMEQCDRKYHDVALPETFDILEQVAKSRNSNKNLNHLDSVHRMKDSNSQKRTIGINT
jgi:hypothetical protein